MRICVESNESPVVTDSPRAALTIVHRKAWQTPRLVAVHARLAEADHGGIHFDGVGFIS